MAALYDDLILDHIRNARNYRVPPRVSREVSGSNALCGDELVLYLDMGGGRIVDIGFQCSSCGLSMASSSVMTEVVKGATTGDAILLIREFTGSLGGTLRSGPIEPGTAQQALLDAARRFPSRAQCVAMPWTTLLTALAGTEQPSSPSSHARIRP
ncbi:MAG: iron-sulfur cluster assembly scaffold protein [Betaproteobacteria bacterium]